jgi:hypothetical protein
MFFPPTAAPQKRQAAAPFPSLCPARGEKGRAEAAGGDSGDSDGKDLGPVS